MSKPAAHPLKARKWESKQESIDKSNIKSSDSHIMTYIPAADLFNKYPKISMFRASVQRGWGGLSYLILKTGFPLVDAMQDAMDLKQFVQVLDLLEQIPQDTDLTVTNEQGKNLYHILAGQAT